MLINPAVAGSEYFHEIKVGYRNQWMGLKNSETGESVAPRTFYLSGHGHIGQHIGPNRGRSRYEKFRHHGIGGIITNDEFGPFNTLSAYLVYAYNLMLSEYVNISFGAGVGMQQWRLDGSKLLFAADGSGPQIGTINKTLPDANIGGWLQAKNYFIGFSTHQIFQNQFNLLPRSAGESSQNKLNVHYFLYTGYNVKVHEQLVFVPSILLKYVNPVPLAVDLNCKMKYSLLKEKKDEENHEIWGGISYRHQDALFFLLGFSYKHKVDLGISYDAIISNLGPYQKGSMELFLGLRFPPKQTVASPSDFWK